MTLADYDEYDVLTTFDPEPLPDWVEYIRPTQQDAIQEINDAYRSGADVVMLDAPTGAGKTLIAELVRRSMWGQIPLSERPAFPKALYICNTIGLQEQFIRDFPYAKLIKGRGNYIPLEAPTGDYTCADCLGAECDWCLVGADEIKACPYESAAITAEQARIAVTNTSYFVHAANFAQKLQGRDLVIADESDTLESILTGFIQFQVSERWLKRLNIVAPKKGSHFPTVQAWVRETLLPAIKDFQARNTGAGSKSDPAGTVKMLRLRREVSGLAVNARRFLASEGEWIRDNDAGPFVYQPITVGPFGAPALWAHGKKWLCMSGSIVSMREQVTSLGAEDLDVRLVNVPMAFPVENRPIILAPVANMTYSAKEEEWPKLATAIGKLLAKPEHQGERVLIHCVSYALAKYLINEVQSDRPLMTYESSQVRDHTFRLYTNTPGAVLFAPSMDRGFDFKEDLARVVIVAKVPFPSLGDKRVSARLHTPGGQEWYNVQAVRSILQMTGRGVRSETDRCTTYILDAQFGNTLWPKAKTMFPQWWRDAITRGFNWRELR